METKVENAVTQTPEVENSREIKVVKKFGPISVHSVETHKFREGYVNITLKQEVTKVTTYPGASVNNSLNSSLFEDEEVSSEKPSFTNTEMRVCFINSDKTDFTVEQFQEVINNHKKAVLYRKLSNHPIFSKEDVNAIKSPDLDIDKPTLALKQLVRYPKNHEKAGDVIQLDNGKIQYRRVCFSKTPMKDVDDRNDNIKDQYMPEEIEALLNNHVQIENQEII